MACLRAVDRCALISGARNSYETTSKGDRYVTTFMKFLQTDAGRKAIDPEFLDRLTRANTKIDTLTALLKFARERWPDQFPADFRKDSGTAFGREAMRKIWRDYLTWSEGKPAKAA
jgi:hypothetical protein